MPILARIQTKNSPNKKQRKREKQREDRHTQMNSLFLLLFLLIKINVARISSFQSPSRSQNVVDTTISLKQFRNGFQTITTYRPEENKLIIENTAISELSSVEVNDISVSETQPTSSPSSSPTEAVPLNAEFIIIDITKAGRYVGKGLRKQFIISCGGDVEITGNGGINHYKVLPFANQRITINDFQAANDVFDFLQYPSVASIWNIGYQTYPLVLLLRNSQQIRLPNYNTMQLSDQNFIFVIQDGPTSSTITKDETFHFWTKDLISALTVLCGLCFLVFFFYFFYPKIKRFLKIEEYKNIDNDEVADEENAQTDDAVSANTGRPAGTLMARQRAGGYTQLITDYSPSAPSAPPSTLVNNNNNRNSVNSVGSTSPLKEYVNSTKENQTRGVNKTHYADDGKSEAKDHSDVVGVGGSRRTFKNAPISTKEKSFKDNKKKKKNLSSSDSDEGMNPLIKKKTKKDFELESFNSETIKPITSKIKKSSFIDESTSKKKTTTDGDKDKKEGKKRLTMTQRNSIRKKSIALKQQKKKQTDNESVDSYSPLHQNKDDYYNDNKLKKRKNSDFDSSEDLMNLSFGSDWDLSDMDLDDLDDDDLDLDFKKFAV
jgi:hypothetical protein